MVSTRLSRLEGHRRKFMAVIDNTPECSRAVHYAGRRAKNSNGGLVLIYVIPEGDFQQWLGVEEIMRAEAREEAEAVMAKAAQTVRETIGIEPEIVIREGNANAAINGLIEEDRDIAILVLAAGSSTKEGPGPLVSMIAGRGAAFPIPVTVLPDSLTNEEIDALC
ncbi:MULTISPECIES: universal stress protein [Alphaproteobacteria]|uniref:Universal stress protein A n=2 Tax=Alphaproteobacteria TaxID=28211 RepID=A0A512HDW6_9HYPH|nr:MULTISPECIES: universal stress protein [Alphaproteobacteria]GEO83639.1 universal stress protein A [Ciceribacter naphthalenivorans]GLR24209.1 universal stress protein A [Ciceribacter naphthalenivorans]GLT07065.1 universal stress protein A [Sphingomonas psychrolutea]